MKPSFNGYRDDAAEMARLVRQANEVTAVRLLATWGSKQRDIGSLKAIAAVEERIGHAQA